MEIPANVGPAAAGALGGLLAGALTACLGGTTACSPHLRTRARRRIKAHVPAAAPSLLGSLPWWECQLGQGQGAGAEHGDGRGSSARPYPREASHGFSSPGDSTCSRHAVGRHSSKKAQGRTAEMSTEQQQWIPRLPFILRRYKFSPAKFRITLRDPNTWQKFQESQWYNPFQF